LEENHFSPSITHSSPSRRARQTNSLGSAQACGAVIENVKTISPSSSGCRYRAICPGVPNIARISALPMSGAAVPKTVGAQWDRPRISLREASFTCP
jgi:hypothetical protein